MAVDNFARALAAKALEGSIGSVTPEDLEKKYDKTGGTISGDVSIQGNLTVSGTTTTEKEKQLLVEENVIATNANKVDLKTLLSGLAINKNASATYGIMYDPADDSVKLGLGTLDAEKKFTFNDSGTDGKAIATRADSSELTDGDLVKWDGTTNSLVDSGKKTDDFVPKVTVTSGSNLAYVARKEGTQGTIPIEAIPIENSIVQRLAGGVVKVGTAVEYNDAMPKKQVEDGFVKKGTSNSACYCIDYTGSENMVNYSIYLDKPYTLAQRDVDSTLKVGTPVGVSDATTKKYVDDGFVAKVTTGNVNQAYTVDTNNQQAMMWITEDAGAWALARRYTDGRLQVGTPVGVNDATTKAYVDNLNAITITAGA